MKKIIFFLLFQIIFIASGYSCFAQLNNVFTANGSWIAQNGIVVQFAKDLGVFMAGQDGGVFNWRDIQPTTNFSFNWGAADSVVRNLQNDTIDLFVTLRCINPLWLGNPNHCDTVYYNAEHGQSWFPKDTIKWKIFIDSVIERYDKNGIRDMPGLKFPVNHWRIETEWTTFWCSPFGNYTLQKAQEFTQFVNLTYTEIKKRQSNATVSFAGLVAEDADEIAFYFGYPNDQSICTPFGNLTRQNLSNDSLFLQRLTQDTFLLHNAYFDALDIHEYGRWKNIPDIVNWLKMNMGINKPIMFLEGGGPYRPLCDSVYNNNSNCTLPDPAQLLRDNSAYVVQYFITGIANNVSKMSWHITSSCNSWGSNMGNIDLLDSTGQKRPSYFTYKFLAHKLKSNASSIIKINSFNPNLYYYRVDPLGTSVMWSLNYYDTVKIITSDSLKFLYIPITAGDSTIDTVRTYGTTNLVLSQRVPVLIEGGNFVISVSEYSERVQTKFKLYQNYPNPFNPSTKIRFSIPPYKEGQGDVSLKIYDILGREIATMVNEKLQPGSYEVDFDGSNYPSGVYFYKLSSIGGAGDFTETKKMLLIK